MSSAGSDCPVSTDPTRSAFCRNTAAATHLKLLSLAVILVASAAGISAPVALSRLFKNSSSSPKTLTLIKSFAAGVILSTSLVHVLPDSFQALSDCHVASRHPWRDFPFSGLGAIAGALLALLVDVAASSHLEEASSGPKNYERIEKVGCHAAKGELESGVEELELEEEERLTKLKQRMVSQVLEIGIIFHSVIIGVTMGMSQNRCTIRPLVVALAFHQVFEGMGLGGCIAQVKSQVFV